MCIVCVLWEQEKLTRTEARKALTEVVFKDEVDPEHVKEVLEKLKEEEGDSK